MPALFVQSADRRSGETAAVGEEDESLAGVGILVADAAQMQGLGLLRPLAIQGDQLVRLNAVLAVLGRGVDPMPE